MGGNALVPGNATPAAEANIHNDPEAADLVFNAHWPVTMVGLDVTHTVNMTPDHLEQYAKADNPLAQHITAHRAALPPLLRECVPYRGYLRA